MKYFVVDAFCDTIFEGNPAGVCIMDQWLNDTVMQKIAMENNLSETAFAVREKDAYGLRWFTPGGEIDLCGHATLAAAYVLKNFVEPEEEEFRFETKSGRLTVVKKGDLYEMDFPAYDLVQAPVTEKMAEAVGAKPLEAWMGRDLVCVLDSEETLRRVQPNQSRLLDLDGLLCHLTARGKEFDCVTRTFAPKLGVAEDPVCGSGHCHVVPLWSRKLGKDEILAKQASPRGGILYCAQQKNRIRLAGKAVLYLTGELHLDSLGICSGLNH